MNILLLYIQERKESVYIKYGTEKVVEMASICLDSHLLEVDTSYERITLENTSIRHSLLFQKIDQSDVLVLWDPEAKRNLLTLAYHYDCNLGTKRIVILKDYISRLRTYERDTFSSILWKHGIFYDMRLQSDAEYNVSCLKRLYRLV